MNAIELYTTLRPFPLADFGAYFSNFKESAFRLEMLSAYNVPQEADAIKSFLAGQKNPPEGFNKEWHDILNEAKSAGKRFSRVRVVDGQPSNYIKFETSFGYTTNVKLGEDIRFILRDEAKPFNTAVPILKDYWLFDESACFLMEYDYLGSFLGVTKVPDDLITLYVDLMLEAQNASIPFEEALRHLHL